MIIVRCEQKTDEWNQARLGIPTASEFHRILTPTGKLSEQAGTYRNELLAEWLTGRPLPSFNGDWMERGTALEGEARDYYELLTDRTVEQVGFIYKDERRIVGCSPDGLFENGMDGLEIKVPKPSTHIYYLLNESLPTKYICQVQGAMWITEAKTWEWLSYNPDLPPVLIRVRRDSKYIDALEVAMESFIAELLRGREKLMERGLKPIGVREALEASLEVLNERRNSAAQ